MRGWAGAVKPGGAMRALIVVAHPMRGAFCAALGDAVGNGVQVAGGQVDLCDLGAEGFQPVMQPQDMAQFTGESPPEDVQAHMARIEAAQALAFVFPVWWWSVPAVLKGWFDRVLRVNWAWSDEATRPLALAGKRVRMLATTADSPQGFANSGAESVLRQQLCQGVWGFCGVEDATLDIFHDLHGDTPPELRAQYLQRARQMGEDLASVR